MLDNNKILSIEDIIEKYDAIISDIWGVIHDGYAPYEKSINILNKMLIKGKKIILLSNTPRPGDLSKKTMMDWGINMNDIPIYTSGDAVREQLVSWNDDVFSKLGRKFYHLGENRNQDLLSNLEVERVDELSEANFILISAFIDDDENIDCFDYILEEAAKYNLPAICANPDLVANHGLQLRYCAGAFSERYQKLGGVVYYYGKPDTRIYNNVINKFKDYNIMDKNKILMIGDTLETDILGANKVGIDSVLVTSGNGKKIYDKIKIGNPDIYEGFEARPTWLSYGMRESR
ncbi:MAG: TIGR01459 family HAD-type hydrolase [Rickettsiales bacterium]